MTIPKDKEAGPEATRTEADGWRDDVPPDTQARVFNALIDIMPDRIYAKDVQSRFILANKAVARLMGKASPEEMLGKDDFHFYAKDIASGYFEVEQALLRSGQSLIACEQLTPNLETGEPGWLQTTKVPLRDDEGQVIGLVGLARDITERKRFEAELRQRNAELADLNEKLSETQQRLEQALSELESYNKRLSDLSQTDELTGLNNRRGFHGLGQQSMDLAIRMNKNGLVVISDMDGLKKINDTWGHEVGDRAIIAMANVLKKTFRSLDVMARLGGDEFSIVAVDVNSTFVETLRTRMNRLIAQYNETSGEPFVLEISIGAAEFSGEQGQHLEQLLARADSALYDEKRLKQQKKSGSP